MSPLLITLVVWVVAVPALVVAASAIGAGALRRRHARRLHALEGWRSARAGRLTPLPAATWGNDIQRQRLVARQSAARRSEESSPAVRL